MLVLEHLDGLVHERLTGRAVPAVLEVECYGRLCGGAGGAGGALRALRAHLTLHSRWPRWPRRTGLRLADVADGRLPTSSGEQPAQSGGSASQIASTNDTYHPGVSFSPSVDM